MMSLRCAPILSLAAVTSPNEAACWLPAEGRSGQTRASFVTRCIVFFRPGRGVGGGAADCFKNVSSDHRSINITDHTTVVMPSIVTTAARRHLLSRTRTTRRFDASNARSSSSANNISTPCIQQNGPSQQQWLLQTSLFSSSRSSLVSLYMSKAAYAPMPCARNGRKDSVSRDGRGVVLKIRHERPCTH